MSERKFNFVSPGIFINEIDNSQLTRVMGDIGPVVIGRTERGPGMRPVKIGSFSEYVEINIILQFLLLSTKFIKFLYSCSWIS